MARRLKIVKGSWCWVRTSVKEWALAFVLDIRGNNPDSAVGIYVCICWGHETELLEPAGQCDDVYTLTQTFDVVALTSIASEAGKMPSHGVTYELDNQNYQLELRSDRVVEHGTEKIVTHLQSTQMGIFADFYDR